MHIRFDREKAKSEQYQENFTKQCIELKKARELLNNANKAIKHKDIALNQKNQDILKYQ